MSTLQCSIYCAGFKKLRYHLKSQGADMMCQNSCQQQVDEHLRQEALMDALAEVCGETCCTRKSSLRAMEDL